MLIISLLVLFVTQVTAVDPPFTPNEKDSIPINRARHLVFFTGESRTGDLNFCENPNGFNLSQDISESCFYEPYAESLILPSVLMIITFLIVLIIPCAVGCSRCCCGGCCRSIKGVCGSEEKMYTNKQWFIFIGVSVAFCFALLPFLISGFYGNSKMTKSFTRTGNALFDTYDDITTSISKLVSALNDIDLSPFEQYLGNDTSLNDALSMLNETETTVLQVDDLMSRVEKYMDWAYIVREVLVDLIFAIPLALIICYFIGAFTKICWLVLPFMALATIFAVFCVALVAFEYPVVTVVADGCTYLIDELDPNATTASKEEDLFMVIRNCENSILNTILTTFTDMETEIIQQALGLFEDVCSNDLINSTDYINYDSEYICSNQSSQCLYDNQDNFVSINPLYCPDSSSVSNTSISEVIALIDGILFMDYQYYWINTDQYTDPMECELINWESTGSYEVSPIACKFYKNLTLDECRTECPSNITEYAVILYDVKQAAEQLAAVIDTVVNDILPLISCDNINTLATELKEAACYDLIEAETPLVVGLYGYGIVLLLFYALSFLSIKRFRRTNYEQLYEDTRYYGDNDGIMLE